MKKIIFTTAFITVTSFFASAQDLQLTYRSLYDVYYIQDQDPNTSSCITSSVETGGEPGHTKIVEEFGEPTVEIIGDRSYLQANKIQKRVEVPATYYSRSVFTNTCSNNAYVKAIRKVRLTTGQIMYEDDSFWVKPGATEQRNIKYVDDYDTQTAEIGSVYAYKNPLNIDSDAYNTYVNSVIDSDKGTLIITPTSTRTRIYLNPGDKAIINATGSIRLGMFAGYSGPDGINGFTSFSATSNARHGALVYSHSGTRDWHYVGSNNTLTTDKAGFLSLTLNDNSTDDDEGQFIVNYEIIRAKSTSAPIFNSLPQSCSDLEKIANFNKKEFSTYLVNNSFISAGEKDGFQLSKRETDDVQLVLGLMKDYSNHQNILFFATDSEEEYLKIKNSFSAGAYVYKRTESNIKFYKKTNSSISTEVGFNEVDDVYQVITIISDK